MTVGSTPEALATITAVSGSAGKAESAGALRRQDGDFGRSRFVERPRWVRPRRRRQTTFARRRTRWKWPRPIPRSTREEFASRSTQHGCRMFRTSGNSKNTTLRTERAGMKAPATIGTCQLRAAARGKAPRRAAQGDVARMWSGPSCGRRASPLPPVSLGNGAATPRPRNRQASDPRAAAALWSWRKPAVSTPEIRGHRLKRSRRVCWEFGPAILSPNRGN